MRSNAVVRTMLEHKTIRKYKARMPSEKTIETVVRAAQQAPFASQSYSILLSKKRSRHPYKAPLMFTICVDLHKFQLIMAERGWKLRTNDLTLLLFGIEDALLMTENMVLAGESLGLGSCLLGMAMYRADRIADEYKLPQKVFPIVQLVMGYPDENPPPRPRYPLEFTLFRGRYPKLDRKEVLAAMRAMDEGYLSQDYYRRLRGKIALEGGKNEAYSYDSYSWTEHICRKWGQWYPDAAGIRQQLEKRGFDIRGNDEKTGARRRSRSS